MKKYLIAISIIIVIFALFLTIPGFINLDINPFQKTTLTEKSIRSIKTLKASQLRTTSYFYQTIFPYDFIVGEPNWGTVLFKNNNFLTDEERTNRDFYNLCKEIGIDLSKNDYFFIIKVEAKAGIDMEEYIPNAVLNLDYTSNLITLKTPISKILTMEVKDDLKKENYPDVKLSPGQWKQLITILMPKIEEEIYNRGYLETSSQESMDFLEKIFLSIGWRQVDFK